MESAGNGIHAEKYRPYDKPVWDLFITGSKNGTFLFYRDYMEYHSDRFVDNSLMFKDASQRVGAVMPANIVGSTLFSHGGLTYGGMVTGFAMTAKTMLSLFDALRDYCRSNGIKRVLYKAIPHIYHRFPADEDLYALYRSHARLVRRDISSTIYIPFRTYVSSARLRNRMLRKAASSGLRVERSFDFGTFMDMQASVLLERHNTKPVHTAKEIEYLAGHFPDRIKLFVALNGKEEMQAGVISFEHETLAHMQYNASSPSGRKIGANDLIYDYLIGSVFVEKRYFDFGISTEDEGRVLNEGLISFKESFGARGTVHDFYELEF